MFGTIYVLTNPFLSFLCIDSIKALRFEPFVPIADNKAFKRLAFANSSFEVEWVEGVEGVLTCGVVGFLPCKRTSVERRGELVWLYGCMVARLNVTHTNAAFWLNSGSGRFAFLQASTMRPTPLPQFSKNVVLNSTSAIVGF